MVRITEKVDNVQETGTAVVNGLEWTTRTEQNGEILNPGDLAKVINISGVKLIVRKYEEEKVMAKIVTAVIFLIVIINLYCD